MKIKFIVLVICLLALYSQKVAGQNQRWTYVGINSMGTKLYIDKNLRRLSDTNIQYWGKQLFRDSSYKIVLVETNCDLKKYRLLQVTTYDPFGRVLSTPDEKTSWSFAPADSVAETELNIVCAIAPQQETSKNVSRKNAFAEIITKNANLRESPNVSSSVVREVKIGEKLALVDVEPVGAWYKVIDAKTKSEGWLHGNTFKMVTVQKKQTKRKRTGRS